MRPRTGFSPIGHHLSVGPRHNQQTVECGVAKDASKELLADPIPYPLGNRYTKEEPAGERKLRTSM